MLMSVSKQRSHIRPVRFLVAASRPAGSLLQKTGVVDVSNEDMPRRSLLLEMTFQAKRGVAFVQQSLIDGTVGRMADHTTLTQCLVLINPRAPLLGVALKASFVSAQESKPTGFEVLLNVCRCAFDRDSLVRVVTIGAAHFAFEHRMVVRQLERRANFQVTLETSLRRLPRIDDRTSPAAGFNVQTPGPVARLAAHVDGLLYSCALCLTAFSAALVYNFRFCSLQSRVGGRPKVAHDFFVAGLAFLRADELRARDAGWRQYCSVCAA